MSCMAALSWTAYSLLGLQTSMFLWAFPVLWIMQMSLAIEFKAKIPLALSKLIWSMFWMVSNIIILSRGQPIFRRLWQFARFLPPDLPILVSARPCKTNDLLERLISNKYWLGYCRHLRTFIARLLVDEHTAYAVGTNMSNVFSILPIQ